MMGLMKMITTSEEMTELVIPTLSALVSITLTETYPSGVSLLALADGPDLYIPR